VSVSIRSLMRVTGTETLSAVTKPTLRYSNSKTQHCLVPKRSPSWRTTLKMKEARTSEAIADIYTPICTVSYPKRLLPPIGYVTNLNNGYKPEALYSTSHPYNGAS